MIESRGRTFASALLAVFFSGCEFVDAQETSLGPSVTIDDLTSELANTSIVWFDHNLGDEDFKSLLDKIPPLSAKEHGEADDTVVEAVYSGINAIVVQKDPATLKEELKAFRESNQTAIEDITGDIVVSIADRECSPKADLPDDSDLPGMLPVGVERINGGGSTDWGTVNKRVWVIDTGVDNSSSLLNVVTALAVNCIGKQDDARQCASSNADDDVGHGTMIAGIIGARPRMIGGRLTGIWGVAPNAKIVPVKAFDSRGWARLSGGPLAALNHVLNTATTDKDIVNMSWGTDWLSVLRDNTLDAVRKMNERVHGMADKGLKVVIAAGNASPGRPNWVQFVSPAASGGFDSPSSTVGEVRTVSAVISEKDNQGNWKPDIFWEDSNFGNQPPDFAEPGYDILSLWHGGNKNRVRKCSGTSFSAAHLAGIYVRGAPQVGGQATGDPDGVPEPIGVAP